MRVCEVVTVDGSPGRRQGRQREAIGGDACGHGQHEGLVFKELGDLGLQAGGDGVAAVGRIGAGVGTCEGLEDLWCTTEDVI